MKNLEDYPELSKWLDDNTWSEDHSELVVAADRVENQLLRMQAKTDALLTLTNELKRIMFAKERTDYDKYVHILHALNKNVDLISNPYSRSLEKEADGE